MYSLNCLPPRGKEWETILPINCKSLADRAINRLNDNNFFLQNCINFDTNLHIINPFLSLIKYSL